MLFQSHCTVVTFIYVKPDLDLDWIFLQWDKKNNLLKQMYQNTK